MEGDVPRSCKLPRDHAHALFVACAQVVEEADAEEGGWIQTFSRIERLTVRCADAAEISLVPFHRFSSSLKYLRITALLFPREQVFNLIHSLPLLEDLALIGHDTVPVIYDDEVDVPQTSPVFTGTLVLLLYQGLVNTARRLLDLPNGLHFRKLDLWWGDEEELRLVKFVVVCSDSLECLELPCWLNCEIYLTPPLDRRFT